MPYFSIEGYQPRWLEGLVAITNAHDARLSALPGRTLTHAWLIWDLDANEWFADGPVLLDFDGEQVEINHQKFWDLSITWNSVDPVRHATWSDGDDDDPAVHTFHLSWRRDSMPELAALYGRQLQGAELLEWAGNDVANGMVAPSFVFPDGRVTIANALDENDIELGAPDPSYRRHPSGSGTDQK